MKDGMKMKKTWGKRNVKRKFNKAKLAALTLAVAMTAAEISALFGGMTSPVFAPDEIRSECVRFSGILGR